MFQSGQQTLIDAGDMHLHESAIRIRDAKSVACVQPNLFRGSVHWNEFRQRYILISGEFGGGVGSVDGEIWCDRYFAGAGACGACMGANSPHQRADLRLPRHVVWCRYSEADAPEGPWEAAVKIVTHSTTGMSFYNPTQHVMFDEAGGELVYLSGTFLTTFSNDAIPVPRYKYVPATLNSRPQQQQRNPLTLCLSVRPLRSYNNIMYRLNLSNVDLTPVPNQIPCSDGVPSGWPIWKIILIVSAAALFVGGSIALLTW